MSVLIVSTEQAAQPLDATHFLQVSNSPVNIQSIEGYCAGTNGTQYWLQILGTSFANSTTGVTVPLWSRQIAGANGFSFTYNDLGELTALMNNLVGASSTSTPNTLPVYIAISSTDAVWTAVAASTNVSVGIEQQSVALPNQVVTGDTTTAVNLLNVWADPSPAKRLVGFNVKNNSGATAYLMLFGQLPSAANATGNPITQWTVAAGASLVEQFGGGLAIQQGDKSFVLHYGCWLAFSTTTQTYTAAGNNFTIQAFNI